MGAHCKAKHKDIAVDPAAEVPAIHFGLHP
jgi:hypothetical protein